MECKNIDAILEKIGLRNQESRVYLKLLELQEAKSSIICERTGIASSNIYEVLSSLVEKGLVSYRMQNNIKVFMPSPPEILNELFLKKEKDLEEQRKEIQSVVKNLKKIPLLEEPQSKYKYYEGISGIKGMWYEINNSIDKNSSERIHSARKEAFEKLIGFYDEHHKIRNKLKAKAKIIIPDNLKNLGKKRANKNTEVRLGNLSNEAEWGVIDDMFYIQYIITKKPRSFLIKDKVFSETFKQVFDSIWTISKG